MPKGILEYDLDDPYDREHFNYACDALDVRLSVCDFDNELRRMAKDWEGDDEPSMDISDVRMLLLQNFEEHGVDWEVF